VRVRLRVRSRTTGRELGVNALVNSGFETFKPFLGRWRGALKSVNMKGHEPPSTEERSKFHGA
jgi:hypothetical protein